MLLNSRKETSREHIIRIEVKPFCVYMVCSFGFAYDLISSAIIS